MWATSSTVPAGKNSLIERPAADIGSEGIGALGDLVPGEDRPFEVRHDDSTGDGVEQVLGDRRAEHADEQPEVRRRPSDVGDEEMGEHLTPVDLRHREDDHVRDE